MAPPPLLADRAHRLVRGLPAGWRGSARRRRFLFLSLCAPGFLAIVFLPVHRNFFLLLAGLASLGLAWGLRRLSEPGFKGEDSRHLRQHRAQGEPS
jgi:hypothetical protein